MAVTTHTCYTLTCDNCGNTIESFEYEGATNTIHSDSPDEARANLAANPEGEQGDGYLDGIHVDGRDICGPCATKQACAERGHRWDTWLTSVDETRRSRWCERDHCCAHESETLAGAAPHA